MSRKSYKRNKFVWEKTYDHTPYGLTFTVNQKWISKYGTTLRALLLSFNV